MVRQAQLFVVGVALVSAVLVVVGVAGCGGQPGGKQPTVSQVEKQQPPVVEVKQVNKEQQPPVEAPVATPPAASPGGAPVVVAGGKRSTKARVIEVPPAPAPVTTKKKEDEKVLEVAPGTVYSTYGQNAAKGDLLYKGKIVQGSLRVDTIQAEGTFTATVYPDNGTGIYCLFDKGKLAALAALKPRSEIVIRGRVKEYKIRVGRVGRYTVRFGSLYLTDCSLVE